MALDIPAIASSGIGSVLIDRVMFGVGCHARPRLSHRGHVADGLHWLGEAKPMALLFRAMTGAAAVYLIFFKRPAAK
jgi:hypothetical protein